VFLTVTNLTYLKKYEGVETVVRGIVSVLAENEGTAYVVAGDGPYHGDLNELIDREIDEYVSHLDGYPNAVLEAQQAGLPVVANAAFGMVEQVEDGETGCLLDDLDQRTWLRPSHRFWRTPNVGIVSAETPASRSKLGIIPQRSADDWSRRWRGSDGPIDNSVVRSPQHSSER